MGLSQILKGDKKAKLGIYILLAVGIGLLLLGSLPGKKESVPQPTLAPTEADYIAALEERLEETLSTIEGAGQVSLTLVPRDRGSVDVGKDVSGESSKTVVLNGQGGSQALVIAEKYPEMRGAIVVAQGAGSDKVRAELTEAVSTALGIGTHRVKVYKMRS